MAKKAGKSTHIDLGTIEAILVNHTVNKKDKNKNKKAGNISIMWIYNFCCCRNSDNEIFQRTKRQ